MTAVGPAALVPRPGLCPASHTTHHPRRTVTTDQTAADDHAVRVLSISGAMCGVCGDEPGDQNCSDCERVRRDYIADLRAAGWAPHAPASPQPSADRTAAPAAWIDGHPRLEAIAAAVWERCRTEDGLVVDDPRTIAVAALAAIMPVLPPPVSRAAVLRDAADALPEADLPFVPPMDRRRVADWLRRMADETPAAACSCGVLRAGPGRHLPECPNRATAAARQDGAQP